MNIFMARLIMLQPYLDIMCFFSFKHLKHRYFSYFSTKNILSTHLEKPNSYTHVCCCLQIFNATRCPRHMDAVHAFEQPCFYE